MLQSLTMILNRILNAVHGHFNDTLGRPELLNRFGDNIIVFDFITDPSIRSKIMNTKLTGIKQHLIENFNLQLELDDTYVQKLVAKGKVGHGGRGLINIIEQQIVNPMSLFIFSRLHQIGDKKRTLFIDADEDGNSRFSFGVIAMLENYMLNVAMKIKSQG